MKLLTEPWLTATQSNGSPANVGLNDLLTNAHRYGALVDPSPVALAAQYRLLLAIVHRVYGPSDWRVWAALWTAGRFDDQLSAYLEQHTGAFDLTRFGQADGGLGDPVSAALLLPHIATGNNPTWADHTTDADPVALSLPEAARALLTHQWGALSGRTPGWARGNVGNGLGAGHMQVMVTGDNLFQTLMLNLVRYDNAYPMPKTGIDAPMWEQADPFAARSVPWGYLDYLTWPTRRIRLVIEDGRVACIRLGPGLALDRELVRDPMRAYRPEGKAMRFSESRALWRDADVLLRLGDEGHGVTQWLASLVRRGVIDELVTLNYTALGAIVRPSPQVYLQERQAMMPLSVGYLADERVVAGLTAALDASVTGAKGLGSAGHALDDALPGCAIDYGRYWSALEPRFHVLYTGLLAEANAALMQWVADIKAAARNALADATAGYGTTPRALRAATLARSTLERRLAALDG
jgi:CRISPR system Cascade subunit CasA